MTVSSLIRLLQNMDPEAPVYLAYPAGDYWGNTLVAEPAYVEETEVEYSEYHRQKRIPPERNLDEYREDRDTSKGVVLSC